MNSKRLNISFFVYNKVAGLLLLSLCLSLVSCKKNVLFSGTGKIINTARELPAFTEIILYDKINLIITYDTHPGLSVEAGENLQQGIETTVADGKLVIRDNNSLSWTRDLDAKVNVYLHSDQLNRITYSGAGNISSTNTIHADAFYMDSNDGTGSVDLGLECNYAGLFIRMANADFTIRGKAGLTTMYCADYGSMNLSDFEIAELNLDYRSIRNSTINVTNLLSAKMLYKGNVYYYGKPEINLTTASTGQLLPLP